MRVTKAPIDWESIELEYRAGVLTLRQIAEQHGITHGAINKRAKKEGWDRDLSAKIKSKTDSLVSKQAVSKEVSKDRGVSEQVIIEANAEMQAGIIIAHRSDIRRNRELISKLTAEVEAITGEHDLLDQFSKIIADGTSDKQLEAFKRVISLPGRVGSVKQLVESLKTLIALEREAFGIDSKKSAGQTLDEFLDGLAAAEG